MDLAFPLIAPLIMGPMTTSTAKEAWSEMPDGWRPHIGDVDRFGMAVEWHEFKTKRAFDWGRTFHQDSVEFCLNFDGHGAVGPETGFRQDYRPGTSGYYSIADE